MTTNKISILPGDFAIRLLLKKREIVSFLLYTFSRIVNVDDLISEVELYILENKKEYVFENEKSMDNYLFWLIKSRYINKCKSSRQNLYIDEQLIDIDDNVDSKNKKSINCDFKNLIHKSNLQDPEKIILLLCYKFNLSYNEISEFLEMPLSSVKVKIHFAKEMLRIDNGIAMKGKQHSINGRNYFSNKGRKSQYCVK
jgi:RNA polymerase sigma-70 factor (ECF subfamily)